MLAVEFDALVSSYRNEKRTFTDRSNGQTREYVFCQLAGITCDLTTPYLLRVPESVVKTGQCDFLRPGVFARIRLASSDLTRGILEGSVLSVCPAPDAEIQPAFG